MAVVIVVSVWKINSAFLSPWASRVKVAAEIEKVPDWEQYTPGSNVSPVRSSVVRTFVHVLLFN